MSDRHPAVSTPVQLVEAVYERFDVTLPLARERYDRALTLAEKVLFTHMASPADGGLLREEHGTGYRPDRVAMHDATAPMAVLQFMLVGRERVAVPTTVHCDHLVRAHEGADADLAHATEDNREVYEFLRSASQRHGMGLWLPGSGTIHQVVLENYAFPGGMMVGTDSHTPTAGGVGMVAIGVGGADAVEVMVGMPWTLRVPRLIGVELTGRLNGWTASRDVALRLAEILTVTGGAGAIVEFFGPGAERLSATGRATICSMSAAVGATTSVFAFDDATARYLRATGREPTADLAAANAHHLRSDPEVYADPERYYDRVVRIDLDALEPHVVGPHSPERARPVGRMQQDVDDQGWPQRVSAALIGSCTNSSYEDITRVASLARVASQHGLSVAEGVQFMIAPGSEQVRATIERDGLLADLEAIGGVVLANACGPCVGQWRRDTINRGETNAIVTSYNRTGPRRNDGNPATLAFVASPEQTVAIALSGRLGFDPRRDTITAPDGTELVLPEPVGQELPDRGLDRGAAAFVAPVVGEAVEVVIAEDSERLQRLEPFPPNPAADLEGLPVLLKVRGRCTADDIAMAGSWLRFSGHLENTADSLYLGATNAFTGDATALDVRADDERMRLPDLARRWHQQGVDSVVVGDENHGEGSSREHAAMAPRHRGVRAVIARSFARIHETNLKRQGVLPLTFVDPADHARVQQHDRVTVRGIADLAPGVDLTLELTHGDGTCDAVPVRHTLTDEQIAWYWAGSALNTIRAPVPS